MLRRSVFAHPPAASLLALAAALALHASPATLAQADDQPDGCAQAAPWPIDDPASPGNTPDGGVITGHIDSPGDVDFFALQLAPNFLYRFNPWTLDCGICPRARAFAADCTDEIARLDPVEPPKVYWFLAPADGIVRIAIDSPQGVVGDYTVPIDLIGGPFIDDHPSATDVAEPIAADGRPVSGSLEFGQDADCFVLTARAGALYRLDVPLGLEGSSNLIVTFGPLPALDHAVPVAQVPDPTCLSRPEGCTSTRLIARADEGGHPTPLYITVRRRDQTAEGVPPLAYQFTITDEGDFIPTPAATGCTGAPPVGVGSPVAARLPDQGFAFQLWSFAAQARHVYRVRLDATIGAGELIYGVTDSACGDTFAYADPAMGQFSVYFRSPDDLPKRLLLQRTFVRLDAFDRPIPGWCILRVDDLGPLNDPEPDSVQTAAPLAVGGAITAGTIDYGGDADWFTGSLAPGVNYRVELRVPSQGATSGVTARAFAGTSAATVFASRTGGHPPEWFGRSISAAAGGPLSIEIQRAQPGEEPVAYELRVIRPDCRADWDGSGAADAADLFAYLTDYFSGRGEFDSLGASPGVGDLLAFLQAWFTACP